MQVLDLCRLLYGLYDQQIKLYRRLIYIFPIQMADLKSMCNCEFVSAYITVNFLHFQIALGNGQFFLTFQ